MYTSDISYITSNGHTFVIPLITSPFSIFTFTTLTCPSLPGKTLTTLPSGHLPLGIYFSITKTISRSAKSLFSSFHLLLLFNWGSHSLTHLVQKCFKISCTLRHLCFRLNPVESSTSSRAQFPPPPRPNKEMTWC